MAEPTRCPCGGQAWHHPEQGAPLCCADCGSLWPGVALPSPYQPYEGYGIERGQHVPWGRRVNGMLHELAEREEERAAAIERELGMVAPDGRAAA